MTLAVIHLLLWTAGTRWATNRTERLIRGNA